MENVVVVIGAGQIGQAIARRVGVGKHIVLADRSEANANTAAEVMANAGYLPFAMAGVRPTRADSGLQHTP